MKIHSLPVITAVMFSFVLSIFSVTDIPAQEKKLRIIVIDSYHEDYLWSQETCEGVCRGLLDFKFFNTEEESCLYNKSDYIETDKLVMKKIWMDTKRKSSKSEIADAIAYAVKESEAFRPDIILLGDDNAANYVGNHYLDSGIPIVFWGINVDPTKYGIIDSLERPGHNITGVYQPGYPVENVEYMLKLVPGAKTFGILSDDSETGRARAKEYARYNREGKLALRLADTVLANSFTEWKEGARRLHDKVDVICLSNHNTLKDDDGTAVDQMKAGAWYLKNIKKPDFGDAKQFVREGVLLCVDDSGFKQGYEAVNVVNKILREGKAPADIASYAPPRGKIIVNRKRAEAVGVDLKGKDFIEEFVDTQLALEKYPE